MKFLEETIKTGIIPRYNIEEDLENIQKHPDKPSSRITQTKIGLKTIKLLTKIEKENNHSWYTELKERSEKKGLHSVALFYRGNKITYKTLFKKADNYAKALHELGIKKGDEIPCCLSNTPELVYMMLGANKIGAVLNLFGTNLDSEYLKKILINSNSKIIFVTDNNYETIKPVIDEIGFDKKVVFSLCDSLPEQPELCDEYEPELKEYYYYDNIADQIKTKESNILTTSEFEELGKKSQIEIIDNGNLDTLFTITYTSGSTKTGYPKQIMHCNRSYIIGGIYNDSNLTGSPEVPEIRGLAHIHPDSNTNLITCISDNLIKHGSVALEPEYDQNKFLDYLILNKPVHLDATTSFLVRAAKQYLVDKKHHEDGKGKKMPYLLVAMAVGEKTTPGEEKFITKFLRESRAGSGIKLNNMKLPFAPLSIGGGDCEHGGIFYSLLKEIQHMSNVRKIGKKDYGMTPVPFAICTALKLNDQNEYEECNYNEYGIIVANSITSMSGYKNNKETTLEKIIRDKDGRDWLSCDVYGYINNLGNVIVKGRVKDTFYDKSNNEVPTFIVDDVVCKDTKNILSCTTVKTADGDEEKAVANIELSPLKKNSTKKVLKSLEERCKSLLSKDIQDVLLFRIIDNEKGYQLTGSGKRDIHVLEKMGVENTYELKNGVLIPYVPKEQEVKKKKI